jgi:transcription-repair coupling factor (superfamily II helicase)
MQKYQKKKFETLLNKAKSGFLYNSVFFPIFASSNRLLMSPTELIQYFTPPQKEFLEQYLCQNHPKGRLSLSGLVGSSLPLLLAPLLQNRAEHQLFILPDRETAAFFYRDMEVLLNDQNSELAEKKVHYFPSSYRRAYKLEEIDNANVKLRSEILNKLLTHEDKYLIVTYPDAISEKLVSNEYLKRNSFVVKKGELLPIDIFLEFLYEYSYRQEEFVFEPGQFAWRGGIFDIFSYSEEYPFRIVLSGDNVESIRLFDPATQLSIREVDSLNIMPMISGVEIIEKKVSFFDFLIDNTVYWLMNIDDIQLQIDLNFKKVVREFENLEATLKHLEPQELCITGEDFFRHILDHQIVEINSKMLESYELELDFEIQPQNAFAKSFDYLLLEWINNHENGLSTLFLSESPNQLSRVTKIISDMLVAYNKNNHTEYSLENLFIPIDFIVHEGFRDEKGKLCLYTDHQFFEKYHRFSIRDRFKKSEQFTLKEIYDLQPGDYVVHIDHGVGIYRGLEKIEVDGKQQEAIKLEYKSGDILYISIHSLHKISKYVGKEGTAPTLHRIGSGTWDKLKEKTKKRVKEIAIDLIKLYAKRKAQKGFAYSPDNYLQTELKHHLSTKILLIRLKRWSK